MEHLKKLSLPKLFALRQSILTSGDYNILLNIFRPFEESDDMMWFSDDVSPEMVDAFAAYEIQLMNIHTEIKRRADKKWLRKVEGS